MGTGRLEAFSDGVIAIIITIMVLEVHAPQSANVNALINLIPVFLSYILSFIYVGIYWNNHHHLLHAAQHVNGGILWANLHLLFWLSLIPFTTAWMGENHFAALPVALYGAVLFMAAFAYYILARLFVTHDGRNSTLSKALGRDTKGLISLVIYGLAIPLAFYLPWIALGLYVIVATLWLIPDRRIEHKLEEK